MVFPALFSTVHFSLIGGANRSGLVAQTGRGWEPGQRASAGHTAPTRPCSAPPGLRMPSCLQGGTQERTGGSRRRIGVSDSRGAEPFSLYCISKSDRPGRFWQTVPPTEFTADICLLPRKNSFGIFKITGIMDIQLGRRETDAGHHKRTVSQTEKLGERKETPESGGDGLHLFTGTAGTAGESGPERPGVDDCG